MKNHDGYFHLQLNFQWKYLNEKINPPILHRKTSIVVREREDLIRF